MEFRNQGILQAIMIGIMGLAIYAGFYSILQGAIDQFAATANVDPMTITLAKLFGPLMVMAIALATLNMARPAGR